MTQYIKQPCIFLNAPWCLVLGASCYVLCVAVLRGIAAMAVTHSNINSNSKQQTAITSQGTPKIKNKQGGGEEEEESVGCLSCVHMGGRFFGLFCCASF
jgi:hypothetical protein